jgi:hypothetical protein
MNAVLQPIPAYAKTDTDRLIDGIHAEAKQYAERVGAGTTIALQRECGLLAGALRTAKDELARYTGKHAKPQAGCTLMTVTLAEATVLIEYEYTAGEEGSMNPDSPRFGPGYPASVAVIQALVNGEWVDPADCFSEAVIERWEQSILEGGE